MKNEYIFFVPTISYRKCDLENGFLWIKFADPANKQCDEHGIALFRVIDRYIQLQSEHVIPYKIPWSSLPEAMSGYRQVKLIAELPLCGNRINPVYPQSKQLVTGQGVKKVPTP